MAEYVLGTNEGELERLRFQQQVWGPVTAALLERVGLAPGACVLDVGCGPGLVTETLRERVGASGRVVALDESPVWHAHLAATIAERGWTNVEPREGKVEAAVLEPDGFDLVFARWVLSFVADLAGVVGRLARCLRPGGVLVVQDYNHEGVSLFPRSPGFDAMIRAARELYAGSGGDAWVVGRLPAALRSAGLELEALHPHVMCGGPGSPVFRWAESFFVPFSTTFCERGLVSEEERAAFLAEWRERAASPDTLFFSPMVVDVVARRPGGVDARPPG